jgi:hypothetical protein
MCVKSFAVGFLACVVITASMGAIGGSDSKRERYLEACVGLMAEMQLSQTFGMRRDSNYNSRTAETRIQHWADEMQRFTP